VHHSLVRDVMATEVATVEPSTPFKEIAARLARHRVGVVPVLDPDRRVLGVVTEADLLRVFTRPDRAIEREIMDEVIVADFMMAPNRFFIHVDNGVVVLQGRVERRSLIPDLVRAVHGVEGVVRAENRLTFDLDDSDAGTAMTYSRMWS
jgi:CBS domain-containing protein